MPGDSGAGRGAEYHSVRGPSKIGSVRLASVCPEDPQERTRACTEGTQPRKARGLEGAGTELVTSILTALIAAVGQAKAKQKFETPLTIEMRGFAKVRARLATVDSV